MPALALAFAIYFLVSTADLAVGGEGQRRASSAALLVLLLAVQFVRSGIAYARGRADLSFGPLLQPARCLVQAPGHASAITIALVATVPWLGPRLGLFLVAGRRAAS